MSEKCLCCFKVNPDPKGKREALAEAEIALSKMRTSGWKIVTWHNLYWCWKLENRYITVMSGYRALMSDKQGFAGSPAFWIPENKRFRDPNKAVDYTFKAAERFHNHIANIIGEQRDAFRGLYAKYEQNKNRSSHGRIK